MNSWKSDKFMDLVYRPWSLNTYVYSKIWFKCHTVDLRLSDISTISSKAKSWLFQDCLEKPDSMILHRPINYGGLGLHEVGVRSKACLTKTFIELAVNPNFINSLWHSLLFRAFVLNEESLPVKMPPYFSKSFFANIRWVMDNTSYDVYTMSTAQWYRIILERDVIIENYVQNREIYKMCKAETTCSEAKWEQVWRRARLKGLGGEVTSLLWKILHLILPTENRVARIIKNSSDKCRLSPNRQTGSLKHTFFDCSAVEEVGVWIKKLVQSVDPTTSPEKILTLSFECETSEEMPLTWLIGHTFLHLWKMRNSGKGSCLIVTRSYLESQINLIRRSRYSNEYEVIQKLFKSGTV